MHLNQSNSILWDKRHLNLLVFKYSIALNRQERRRDFLFFQSFEIQIIEPGVLKDLRGASLRSESCVRISVEKFTD